MITKKELVPLEKRVGSLASQVELIVISSSEDMKSAVSMLSQMNTYGDTVKAKKELLTKPLNEALKNARAMFKPIEDIYEGAIASLRSKMTLYQTLQVKLRKDEEMRIASRIGAGRGKLTIETAVKKIENIEEVVKEVATDAGLVQFRETRILKIVDEKLIPREYLHVNATKILKDLKEGKKVLGCEIEVIQVPANYR